MADLTDEERATAVLGEEVEPTGDETPAEPVTPPEDELEPPEPEEELPPEEKPTNGEEDLDSTFTKQFPNLKGDTLQEYTPELEKAYDNSFKEALRLNKENQELKASLAGQAPQPANPTPPVNPALAAIDDHPAIQYAKAKQTEDMISAFDDFKKQYPQATEQQAFDSFTKASDGVNNTLATTLGRTPTYQELFPAIARLLGWQPASNDAIKNAAIKENASSNRTPGSQSPAPPKPSKVSDAQVDTYLKMFTSKTREDAIKELSEVK